MYESPLYDMIVNISEALITSLLLPHSNVNPLLFSHRKVTLQLSGLGPLCCPKTTPWFGTDWMSLPTYKDH